MAKIYVVTAGRYSEYRIFGASVDKSEAEKLLEIVKRDNYYGEENPKIEEFPDFSQTQKMISEDWRRYCVKVYENGDCEIKEDGRSYSEIWRIDELQEKPKGYFRKSDVYNPRSAFVVHCAARNEDHAKKIAFDSIAQYKAEQEGIC